MTNKKFYNCFSTGQFRYLVSQEIDPVMIQYHDETKVKFYIFVRNDKLDKALDGYKMYKKLKRSL